LWDVRPLKKNGWRIAERFLVGALVITAVMYASTYLKSRSVICAALEHALWGNLIFTIGLGPLFAGGTVANLLK
jgi:hypothetical protein